MKRTILALYLLPLSFSSLSTATDLRAKGMLRFVLRISQGACELVRDGVEIDMGLAVLKKSVRIGTELNPTTFSIGLKNCNEAVRTYATMNGTPNVGDPDLLALDAGGAMGVGLKIKASVGVQQFPKNTTLVPIEFVVNGDDAYQLNYTASYMPPRANATIGRADTTVDFTAQYE